MQILRIILLLVVVLIFLFFRMRKASGSRTNYFRSGRQRYQDPQKLASSHGEIEYRRLFPTYRKGREIAPPGIEFAIQVESGGGFEILARNDRGLAFWGLPIRSL